MIDNIIRLVLSTFHQIRSVLQQLFTILYQYYSYYSQSTSSSSTTTSKNIRNKIIEFDTGIIAKVEYQIAEGGFSYIYSAHDVGKTNIKYALKRIICPDDETLALCRAEAKVHRMVDRCDNTLKLLGMKIEGGMNSNISSSNISVNDSSNMDDRVCYMLFPLITGGTLRDEITKRQLLQNDNDYHHHLHQPQHLGMTHQKRNMKYMTNLDILQIFKGILVGVKAMHDVGFAHCDIKLENVMLDKTSAVSYKDEEMGSSSNTTTSSSYLGTPILMDFGSARPLVIKLTNRMTVLKLAEEAAKNSTVCYRAPELFDGGCRHGPDEPDVDGKVDVWSCGCVLYGLMYGTSPFEMEFRQDGSIRIVECTHLRVLSGKIPSPPKSKVASYGYMKELNELIEYMLVADREARPDLDAVIKRVENLILSCKGRVQPFDGIIKSAIV